MLRAFVCSFYIPNQIQDLLYMNTMIYVVVPLLNLRWNSFLIYNPYISTYNPYILVCVQGLSSIYYILLFTLAKSLLSVSVYNWEKVVLITPVFVLDTVLYCTRYHMIKFILSRHNRVFVLIRVIMIVFMVFQIYLCKGFPR